MKELNRRTKKLLKGLYGLLGCLANIKARGKINDEIGAKFMEYYKELKPVLTEYAEDIAKKRREKEKNKIQDIFGKKRIIAKEKVKSKTKRLFI